MTLAPLRAKSTAVALPMPVLLPAHRVYMKCFKRLTNVLAWNKFLKKEIKSDAFTCNDDRLAMQFCLTFASRSAYIHTKQHQHRNHNTRDQQYLFCHFECQIQHKAHENNNPQYTSVFSGVVRLLAKPTCCSNQINRMICFCNDIWNDVQLTRLDWCFFFLNWGTC